MSPMSLGVVIEGLGHPSQLCAVHKQCMDEWWVRADHASFSSLPGRPVWPQLPGDVPESPGLPGAELLPARPLRLLLRLGLEWLPLRPRYRDMGIHQLSLPAWASSRAWLLCSSTCANLSQSEGRHRLSSTAACISCLLSLSPWSYAMARGSSELSSSHSLSPRILWP